MPIFIVSVPRRKEFDIALRLFSLRKEEEVYAIYVPPEATRALFDRKASATGYIFIEAKDRFEVEKLLSKLIRVRRRIQGELSEEEARERIRPKIKLKIGMKVRIIHGPFAGQEAIVERVIESKNKVGVKLLSGPGEGLSFYIEVPADDVRVIER